MMNVDGLGPPQPTMTVSYKMDITTYGTHNGVFITTGIQSGGPNGQQTWGMLQAQHYPSGANITQVTGAGQPMIQAPPPSTTPLPTQGFGGSTYSISGAGGGLTGRSQPLVGTSRSRNSSRSRSRSRPGSPEFEDSPPDEFLQPEKVQLNVFSPDTTLQRSRDRSREPYVSYPTDYVLNDTTTTTTTVEVFRAKVDKNDPIDYFKLPPDPLGPDQRPMIVRAAGPPYEVQTRTETRFSDRPLSQSPAPRVQWESETDLRSLGPRAESTLSRRSRIGDGASPYQNQPQIGSGVEVDYRQPRIGSGVDPRLHDQPRIGSGVGYYRDASPNIGYGSYPLRRVGSDYDWEEGRFVGPNEMTAYERSRSQSPVLAPASVVSADPSRLNYGLQGTDAYTATILRRQWKEDRDQRVQHKDNLAGAPRHRSQSPPAGADASTYPVRQEVKYDTKRPKQVHQTKSQLDVCYTHKPRYDYPPEYREDYEREYKSNEVHRHGHRSKYSEDYHRHRRQSRSQSRSSERPYSVQGQSPYRQRTYSPANGERYGTHDSRKSGGYGTYDSRRSSERPQNGDQRYYEDQHSHHHRSRRSSRSPDRHHQTSPRARSETRYRQPQSDDYQRARLQPVQAPMSPTSTMSRPQSSGPQQDLKLYQTRDCLGNVLYQL